MLGSQASSLKTKQGERGVGLQRRWSEFGVREQLLLKETSPRNFQSEPLCRGSGLAGEPETRKKWVAHGSIMGGNCARTGQRVGREWTGNRPKTGRKRVENGSKMGRNESKMGRKQVENGSENGSKTGRKRVSFPPVLDPFTRQAKPVFDLFWTRFPSVLDLFSSRAGTPTTCISACFSGKQEPVSNPFFPRELPARCPRSPKQAGTNNNTVLRESTIACHLPSRKHLQLDAASLCGPLSQLLLHIRM